MTVPRGAARLVAREELNATLGVFRFAFEGGPPRFEAGQYVTLGLEGPEGLVRRPYSIASAPEETAHLEFLVRWVVHPVAGALTTLLGRLEVGDEVQWAGPKGHLAVGDDPRRLVLVSAGTGVAPFASIVRHLHAVGDPREVVLVQGASYVDDLAYRADFRAIAEAGRLRYLPTISRPHESHNAAWRGASGRAERWLAAEDGAFAFERELDVRVSPQDTLVLLYGPEGLVDGARAALSARGFRDHDDVRWEAYG